jgi:phosphoribosylformylglycinamidine synthase subunit PurQ / glutaminase
MSKPKIAIISFPGSNGETENLRCFWRNGFDAFVFRWNDSKEKLKEVDGYFIGAGFSYEDRGRAGMVAGRDPLFDFLHEESAKGKVIIGHCNGAQVLVESGLVPVGDKLRMSLARNAIKEKDNWHSPGFLNEWIYITPACNRDRCAASDWNGNMRIPIAHGEGRFITKDPDLISELEKNDQIAFRYCDAEGNVSADSPVTPNGSTDAIAGICNPAGNVVAMMPHAERTVDGDVYFESIKRWIEGNHVILSEASSPQRTSEVEGPNIAKRAPSNLEIFIETIIVNNEERTVEQAAKRISSNLELKQFRYMSLKNKSAEDILTTISIFNPNKEIAYIRKSDKESKWYEWDNSKKTMEPTDNPISDVSLIRRDEPDMNAESLGKGSETGVCYSINNVSKDDLNDPKLQEIFGNPHASVLEVMTCC